MTTISVVMPSYNHGRFIREAIESVLSQDGVDVSLRILDGGSTDETLEILTSFGDAIEWTSGPDDGQSDAINRGLNAATGDVQCWLNSDDTFVDGALEHVVELFDADPDLMWVYGRGTSMAEDGTHLGMAGVREFQPWELIHHRNFIQQPSTFWRRELWDRCGGLDLHLHYVMDWELWMRFSGYPGRFTPVSLSNNRVYADNKTQSGAMTRWEEISRMVRRHSQSEDPPVLALYRMEAEVQQLRIDDPTSPRIRELSRQFHHGVVESRFSGIALNGAAQQQFKLSLFSDGSGSSTLNCSPLSRYSPSRLDADPVEVTWRSDRGGEGAFLLAENGMEQQVELPLAAPAGKFEHFEMEANTAEFALGELHAISLMVS